MYYLSNLKVRLTPHSQNAHSILFNESIQSGGALDILSNTSDSRMETTYGGLRSIKNNILTPLK